METNIESQLKNEKDFAPTAAFLFAGLYEKIREYYQDNLQEKPSQGVIHQGRKIHR